MKHSSFQSRVDSIKDRLDPLSFYEAQQGQLGQRQNKGWRQAGLCPFHQDNKMGSFYVNVENGAFNCFSCGAKGGDIISFIMRRDNLTFSEALNVLEINGGAV